MASTVWRGRLAFGMVAVPVRLYKAARRERIRFHNVYASQRTSHSDEGAGEAAGTPAGSGRPHGVLREFPKSPSQSSASPVPEAEDEPLDQPETVSRVRQSAVTHDAATPVPSASILKGYEVAKDSYVVLKREDIAALRPATSSELQILEFVRLEEIDPIFFDASYYVIPESEGEKPFALLVKALQTTGDVALGNLAMHGREFAVVIRPGQQGLILHTLFYANEIRGEQEWRVDAPVGAKELDLAVMLVRAMESPFDPAKLKDSFEDRLRELIAQRTPTAGTGAPANRGAAAKAPVIDIMEALKRSLAAARKPVQKDRGGESASRQTRSKRRPG